MSPLSAGLLPAAFLLAVPPEVTLPPALRQRPQAFLTALRRARPLRLACRPVRSEPLPATRAPLTCAPLYHPRRSGGPASTANRQPPRPHRRRTAAATAASSELPGWVTLAEQTRVLSRERPRFGDAEIKDGDRSGETSGPARRVQEGGEAHGRASAVKAINARWSKTKNEKKAGEAASQPQTFLVRYEAMREADDAAISERLKKVYPKSLIVFDSTWLLRTSQTPAQIVDVVRPFLRRTDAVLVVPVAGAGAWRGLSTGAAGWLGKNLERSAPSLPG